MRRFTTLALVVLAAGAVNATAAGYDRGTKVSVTDDSEGTAIEAGSVMGSGLDELKAVLHRQEFAESTIDFVMGRINSFSKIYVKGVQNNSQRLKNMGTLEDVIEQKLVPGLRVTFPSVNLNQDGTTEIQVAEPIWARMDSDTQNLIRRTTIAVVEELLESAGAQEGGE